MVTMVCEAGKGWSGVEELKLQQDGQCSAGYVAPTVNSTSNSTETDSVETKSGFKDLTDKSSSFTCQTFSLPVRALLSFYILLVVCT